MHPGSTAGRVNGRHGSAVPKASHTSKWQDAWFPFFNTCVVLYKSFEKCPIRPALISIISPKFAVYAVVRCRNPKRALTQAPHLKDFSRALVFATMNAPCLQTSAENPRLQRCECLSLVGMTLEKKYIFTGKKIVSLEIEVFSSVIRSSGSCVLRSLGLHWLDP